MKHLQRVSCIFLACCILLSSTGTGISLHYCHDQLSGLSFISPTTCSTVSSESKKAPCCELPVEEDEKPCCTNFQLDIPSFVATTQVMVAIDQQTKTVQFSTPFLESKYRGISPTLTLMSGQDDPPLPDIPFRILYQAFLC